MTDKCIKMARGGGKLLVIALGGALVFSHPAFCETESGKPDAYLDYIEATGTQYIDTGVNAEEGLKSRIDIGWDTIPGECNWDILAARHSGGGVPYFLMCKIYNARIWCSYHTWNGGNGNTANQPANRRVEIVTDFSDDSNYQLYINGATTLPNTDTTAGVSAYSGENVDIGSSLYVFAANQGGSPVNPGKGKLYGLKILKKNGANFDLLRHYLPCIKNGRAGLYDKVNGTISYSFSATDFVAGPELPRPVQLVEWIQSNKNSGSMIDTGVYAKSGLKSDLNFIIKDDYSNDSCVLGSKATATSGVNDRFYLVHYASSYFGYGYMTWNKSTTVGTANDVQYHVASELSVGTQSLIVNETTAKSGSDSTYYCTTNSLNLFGLHKGTGTDSSNYSNFSRVRLYSAKISDGDELLRDFVPCIGSDGKAGLYDRVTERIFKSSTDYSLATQIGPCTNLADTVTFVTGNALDSNAILSRSEGSPTAVFPGMQLDEYEPAYAYFDRAAGSGDKAYVKKELDHEILRPYNTVRTGTGDGATLTVQFQGVTRTHVQPHTASVTIKFTQSGSSVYAYVTNAVALKPLDIRLGLDLDAMKAANDEAVQNPGPSVTGNAADSIYNVSVIVFRKPKDATPVVISPFEASDTYRDPVAGNVPVIVCSSTNTFTTAGYFPNRDWTVVAENRNLSDLIEVSGIYHYAANQDEKQIAYNLIDSTQYSTGSKTCQFQHDHESSSFISCLIVEFRQNGDNVEAFTGNYRSYYTYYKNTSSYTGQIDSSLVLGKNFEEYTLSPSVTLPAHSYGEQYAMDDSSTYKGVKNLTLRFGDATHTKSNTQIDRPGYLPKTGWTPDDKMEWVVVARNRDLADLDEVQGCCRFYEQGKFGEEWQTAYNLKYTSLSNLTVYSYDAGGRENNWINNATNMMLKTCQFQHDGYNSSGEPRISCVHVLFRQDGANILAGIGKYRTYNMLKTQGGVAYDEIRLGVDFENYTRSTTPSWAMFNKLITSDTSTDNIGVKDLRLKFRARTASVYPCYMPESINPITGETNWTVVAEGRALSNLVSTAAIFHRRYTATDTQLEVGTSGLFLKFGEDCQTASCQFQIRPRWDSHDYVECVKVCFRQNGDNIEAATGRTNAWNSASKKSHSGSVSEISTNTVFAPLSDFDAFTLVGSFSGTGAGEKMQYGNWATSYTDDARGLRDLRLYFAPNGAAYAAAHTGGGATSLDFVGDADLPLVARTEAATVFPSNGIVTVGPYADLSIMDHVENSRWTQYRVMTNGILRTVGKYRTVPTDQIDLIGGTLSIREDVENGDSECYLNYVTLMDGAVVTGRGARVLHDSNNANWIVAGSAPSTCYSAVVITGKGASDDTQTFFFNVNDVTGDDDTDFFMYDNIYDFGSAHTTNVCWNVNVVKDGAGTMEANKRIQLPNEFIISNGVVRLTGGTPDSLQLGQFNPSYKRQSVEDGDGTGKRVDFVLAGGNLATAAFTTNSTTSNHPNELKVKAADSKVTLGDDSYLVFNSLSFEGDGTLEISPNLSPKTVLKVGTSASLDAATLGKISCDGHRVRQLKNGRLIPVRGMLSLFK